MRAAQEAEQKREEEKQAWFDALPEWKKRLLKQQGQVPGNRRINTKSAF